jgi:hypothetical protein
MINIYLIMVYYVRYVDCVAYDSVQCKMLAEMCWKWWNYVLVKIFYCCLGATSGNLSVNPRHLINYKIE